MLQNPSPELRQFAQTLQHEFHLYLSGAGNEASRNGADGLPDILVNLGKLLCWVGPVIDETAGTANPHWPNQRPFLVHQTGDEIRRAGLQLIEARKHGSKSPLASTLDTLRTELDRLATLAARENGGGK